MRSLARCIVLTLAVLTATNAMAADSAPADHQRDRVRYDFVCTFPSTGCSAYAKIFRSWDTGAATLQPQWGGNLMAVVCGSNAGGLVYANDSQVVLNDGQWEIEGVTGLPELEFGAANPFNQTTYPATITPVILRFEHGGSDTGSCVVNRVS